MSAGRRNCGATSNPRSDDAFQHLLLKFSAAAAEGTPTAGTDPSFLPGHARILSSGWRLFLAARFRRRIGGSGSRWGDGRPISRDAAEGQPKCGAAAEAIRQRKTVYENQLDPARYLMAAEYHARSIMAAPLVVGNEVDRRGGRFCTAPIPISSTTTWPPKPPSWRDNWAACSRPAA